MRCSKIVELENIWQLRYEGARLTERSGLFAVTANSGTHALVLRQQRARQAQAANAILLHQRGCAICGSDTQALESLAS